MRAVPRLCEFYPGICLTTEEKARKNLSQGKKKNLSQGKFRKICEQLDEYEFSIMRRLCAKDAPSG